jgi:hypothetical protein
MSQENVELVRAAYDALATSSFGQVQIEAVAVGG